MKPRGTPLYSIYQKILELAQQWQSGDLVQMANLSTELTRLVEHPQFQHSAKSEKQPWIHLLNSINDLLDAQKDRKWIETLSNLPPFADDRTDSSNAETLEEKSSEASRVGFYSAEYFDHIIEDRKMLGQLCDEVKEHMEIAQFTLVDLEFDSTNPENINKIFRAFHTIKSSAAFLGLKNLEELAHAVEDVLVLVRDKVIVINGDLINLIFYGIGLLKDIVSIMETTDFEVASMIESFREIDIHPSLTIFRKIFQDHGMRKIGEILLEDGLLDTAAVEKILIRQKESSKKFGEIAVEEKLISEADLSSSLKKQAVTVKRSSFVKVSNDRLNGLIDIVGELVVNQSMLRQFLQNPESAREIGERTFAQLESITTNIKNLVLSMGMVPISEIFNKLRVVIRNTATETGKTVAVEFKGEETELDRNVIETIYDPLVHIVRNAVDHGLEFPNQRKELGKPAVGKILISAEHKGNGIEITVSDDGKGIDRVSVLSKALEKEIITKAQAETLTEREVNNLLFLPGFSTKDHVTEVSGRGVGLDVVKQNIDQIHGKVEIQSTLGKGSKFIVRIPLTLAIIDGFVTEVDSIKYIFPFNMIEEIVVPNSAELTRLENGQALLFQRGVYTPIIQAGKIFGHNEESFEQKLIVVMNYEHHRYGITVDSILGKQEIVIKNLNEALRNLNVFSGGTIFGDGSVGFVIDVEKFIAAAREDLKEGIV